jgi:hypothetical protein
MIYLNKYKSFLVKEIMAKSMITPTEALKHIDVFVTTDEGIKGVSAWMDLDIKNNPKKKGPKKLSVELSLIEDSLNPIRGQNEF